MPRRPGLGAALSKLLARGKTRGWGEVLQLGLERVKEEIRSRDVLIFYRRKTSDAPLGSAAGKTAGLVFLEADESHADAYEREIGTDSAATFKSRLNEESRCYLVMDGERVLHASWVTTSTSWMRELRRYFRPPADSAYIYESFTRADARGRGVYPFALSGICESLRTNGVGIAWVAAEEDNPPSSRAIQKAGFEEAFRISYERRLGAISLGTPTGPLARACTECFSKKVAD